MSQDALPRMRVFRGSDGLYTTQDNLLLVVYEKMGLANTGWVVMCEEVANAIPMSQLTTIEILKEQDLQCVPERLPLSRLSRCSHG